MKSFILPTSLLVGTIIGGGIFSLPFVFSKAGILTGIIYLFVFGATSIIIHLLYADIIIRSNNNHRFPGHAEMYLGKAGGVIANITVFVSFTLTLLVYLILSASFVDLIYSGVPEYLKIFIFWFLGSAAIFLNIKKAAIFESATSFITLLIIGVIFIFGASSFFTKLPQMDAVNLSSVFFPLGPILFSLIGISAIPPLVAYFKESKMAINKIKKVTVWASSITIFAYIAFVIGILGLSGKVSEDAVSGIVGYAPGFLLCIIGIFGFASLWDSYASIGTDIKKILRHDWNLPKITVDAIVVLLPLTLYFLGFQNFLKIISIVGGILFSVWGLLLLSIWQKASQAGSAAYLIKKIHPIFIYLLIFIFIGAILYEIKYIL